MEHCPGVFLPPRNVVVRRPPRSALLAPQLSAPVAHAERPCPEPQEEGDDEEERGPPIPPGDRRIDGSRSERDRHVHDPVEACHEQPDPEVVEGERGIREEEELEEDQETRGRVHIDHVPPMKFTWLMSRRGTSPEDQLSQTQSTAALRAHTRAHTVRAK